MRSVTISKCTVTRIDNDPSTAYGSCQEVLSKDPIANDGLYYINNNQNV